jgi:hypothetical protein
VKYKMRTKRRQVDCIRHFVALTDTLYSDVESSKSDKVEMMNKNIELEELQRFIATEKRLSVASTNRENKLSEKSSSAKARLLSPQETPSSNDDLEACIEQANQRREMYLTQKVEKAKKYRNSPINKELFATVSPKQGSEDGSVGSSHAEVRYILPLLR